MKKYWIILAVIVAAIVAVVLVMKFYPVWVTLQNVIVLAVGVALGVAGKLAFDKWRVKS